MLVHPALGPVHPSRHTAHLDADTIEALISSLRTYRGAILLVSHDRHAVKRIIEGVSLSSIRSSLGGGGGASSASSLSEEEEDGEGEDVEIGNGMGNGNGNAVKRLRSVFLVRNAKVRLLKEGMDGYERMVEREL